jgi:hypothetical protein
MRTISIMAFASFLALWGVYSYLKRDVIVLNKSADQMIKPKKFVKKNPDSRAYIKNRQQLDKIGSVINDSNVDLDTETREQIKVAKKVFDMEKNLKEKQGILEQSYMDHASTIKDIKRLQGELVSIKNKMHKETSNAEKWDPLFVYYLMISENYTFSEVNEIKSLSESGLNAEEINYISEKMVEDSFLDKIRAFKNQSDGSRAIASLRKSKVKDEFIENSQIGDSAESKIIEMNYNQDDKEDMAYGSNQ